MLSEVMVVVTDMYTCSSMVAAFRKYVAQDVDEEDDDKNEDAENECDEDDFDDREENDIASISTKRSNCFAHSFQLVAIIMLVSVTY